MMEMCGDNRFELIMKYKAKLIDSTNIETSPDEMKVLDDLMFRLWQMGWLDILDEYGDCDYHCKLVTLVNEDGRRKKTLLDPNRMLCFETGITVEFLTAFGWKIERGDTEE